MPAPVLRDTELFEAIARNEETAFRTLFERYRQQVYATAFKWTKCAFAAEEMVQEVFISLWTSRARLQGVKQPQAYLYTILFHKINRYLKKAAGQGRLLQLHARHQAAYSNETEETVALNDRRRMLHQVLKGLSPQKQLIYQMSREQGASPAEIAEQLGLSPNTVKSHLVQVLRVLRHQLKKTFLLAVLLAGLFS